MALRIDAVGWRPGGALMACICIDASRAAWAIFTKLMVVCFTRGAPCGLGMEPKAVTPGVFGAIMCHSWLAVGCALAVNNIIYRRMNGASV